MINGRYSYCALLFLAFHSVSDACDVNREMLNINANTLALRIRSGIVINQEEIKENLGFVGSSTKSLAWDESLFAQLISDRDVDMAGKKLGHNRLKTFLRESRELFQKTNISTEKYAIYALCRSTLPKILGMVEKIQDDVDEDLIIPDEQLSFFATIPPQAQSESGDDSSDSTSTGLATSEESRCTESDKRSLSSQAKAEDYKLSLINLDSDSFSTTSFGHYEKQLLKADHPIRVSCDLRRVKMNQVETLCQAISEIDKKDLREVIFMNGSSMKFNALFPFLKDFTSWRRKEKKQTIIVFSTTSDSQRAYKKLYTLGEARPIPMGVILAEGTAKIREKSVLDPQVVKTDFAGDESSLLIRSLLTESRD